MTLLGTIKCVLVWSAQDDLKNCTGAVSIVSCFLDYYEIIFESTPEGSSTEPSPKEYTLEILSKMLQATPGIMCPTLVRLHAAVLSNYR